MSHDAPANLIQMEDYSDGGLVRGLKNRHVQLIALGGIIGSGYFLGTGAIVGGVGPGAFISYVLGGLVTYLVMICLGELAVSIPITGSFVTYAADFISPTWGCGVGWAYWLCWVVYIPSECVAGGIIMNGFVPAVNPYFWAILIGLAITIINISHVKAFGEVEFWLALCKILGLCFFSVIAILIFLGLVHGSYPAHIIGTKYLLKQGGLFPLGTLALLNTMVLLLCNYQGSEIIGLSAGETDDPSQTIPKAINSVTARIILLYVIPVCLLVTIFPWKDASVSQSVFAAALNKYGLHWAGSVFSFVALTAAISCSNSGMYGSVRSLFALAREGMAPAFLARLNRNSVPANATVATILSVWLVLAGSHFFAANTVFISLISISGFAATICWISICWAQLNFRKRLYATGYSADVLKYQAPGYPYTSQLGIWIMVACLVFTLFSPSMRIAFYAGVPVFVVPMLLYRLLTNHRKKQTPADRVSFASVFPPEPGSQSISNETL